MLPTTSTPSTHVIHCPEFKDASILFITAMRILGFVSFLVNLLSFIVILLLSPRQMGPTKWYLLVYHFFASFLDLLLTLGTVPVLFLPLPMGYPFGLLSYPLGLPTHFLFMVIISIAFFVFISLGFQFFYRCQTILPVAHPLKLTKLGVILFVTISSLLLESSVISAAISVNPDQYTVRTFYIDNYSCARNILRYPRVQIYTVDSLRWFLITLWCVLVLVVVVIAISLHLISSVLSTNCAHLSGAMIRLQKKYLTLLYIQIAIPLWVIVLPTVIIGILIATETFRVGRESTPFKEFFNS